MSLINPSNADLFAQVAKFARANWALFEDVGFGREDLIKLDAVVRTARDPNLDYYLQPDPDLDGSGPSTSFLHFALIQFKDGYEGEEQINLRRQAEHLARMAAVQMSATAGAFRPMTDFGAGLLGRDVQPARGLHLFRRESLLQIPDMMAPWQFQALLAKTLDLEDLRREAADINDLLAYVIMDNRETVMSPDTCVAGCYDHTVTGTSVNLGGPGVVEAYHAGVAAGMTGWEAVLTGMHVVQGILREAEATEILSHEGCSACAWVFAQLSDEEREKFTSSDEVGTTFAQIVASNLRISHRHIGFTHHEPPRLLFYTGAEKFLLDGVLGEVPFMSIFRSGPKAGRTNLATALRVARGLHNSRTTVKADLQDTTGHEVVKNPLTESRPLLIVPVGGKFRAASDLKDEALEIAGVHGDNVVVLDGFDISEPPQSSGSGGSEPADKTGESPPLEDGSDASTAPVDAANGDLGFTSSGLLSCLVDGASSMVHPPHLVLGTRALATGAARFVRAL